MTRYRKRPIEVDAFQMTKANRWDNSEWPEWLHRAWNTEDSEVGVKIDPDDASREKLVLGTVDSYVRIAWGDYIVLDTAGLLQLYTEEALLSLFERVG